MHSRTSISPSAFLRTFSHRVCVAVQGKTVPELLEHAHQALADTAFLEFRLDTLSELNQVQNTIRPIADFLASRRDVAAIATCRREANGGQFTGSIAEELNILAEAADAGFTIVDLEIETAEESSTEQLEALFSTEAAIMISFHDFQSAADPQVAFERIQKFQPDFVKVATTLHSLADGLNLLRWTSKRSGESQVIGIGMGESGVMSRILGLRAGSAFTFAAGPDGKQTAPGQFTARVLKDLYRIDQLDQATRIYGVAGNPVAHSLSPLMQNCAFHRERINAVYLPLKTDSPEDLFGVVRELPISGLSVTMPLKQSVIPHLVNVDPIATKIGACNTIRMSADGKLYGFNTDVSGIVRPLEKRLSLKGSRILVLGSGGAARAAVFGLADRGANVALWSRSDSKAQELASSAGGRKIGRKQIAAEEFDVLINATPCGMSGNAHSLPLEPSEWRAGLVFDLVYNPLETPLIQEAVRRGVPVIQGVEMFVHQGARQFEIWTGKPAPEAEMLRVVLHSLTKPVPQ